MKINEEGLEIVKLFEGYRSKPYRCSAGVATIGYGSTYHINGDRVDMDDREIDKDEANELLVFGLRHAENAVGRTVKVPLTHDAFSSLTSFVYNVGIGNFRSSVLRSRLNRKDYTGASNEFWKWRRASGRILKGLVKRREFEKRLFLKTSFE